MFTPLRTIKPYVQSIRTHSRWVLCPRLVERLNAGLHRGRTFALVLALSVIVVQAAACTPALPPSPWPTYAPTTAPAVRSSASPVLPHPDQGLRFERISVEQGLSHNTVNCILQDSKGFMWLGTDDGLNRYDAYSFTVYKHDPNDPHSLSHNQIWSLFEDSTGKLWVGTSGGGLNRFDRYTGHFARYETGVSQPVTDTAEEYRNVVWAADGHPASELWIATYGGGLVNFDLETETITSFAPAPADPEFWGHGRISAILVDRSGLVWFATRGEGLSRFDPVTRKTTTYRHNPDIT
ncbi:MAG: two-component regulator propeller domain-containing protein, partial [Anaerolineae bacterium]